jgi:Zn finger protein HypA/HybF involved in hydrogenase expression
MAFSEKIKLTVKKQAGFQCCRCHEIGIDIHHIIPQADSGTDDIDNAAPLCQNCHDRFGTNPEKRKEIKQMRDWWYEVILEKYPAGQSSQLEGKLADINDIILRMLRMHSEQKSSIDALKQELNLKLENLKSVSLSNTRDEENIVRQKTSQYISAITLGNRVHANFQCRKCGTAIGFLVGSNECPKCHTPI